MKLVMGVNMGQIFKYGRSLSTSISTDSTMRHSSCNSPSFLADSSNIPFFRDSREMSSLPAEPLDEDAKLLFKARGEEFSKRGGQHYLAYDGLMIQTESRTGERNGRPKLLHFDVLSSFFHNRCLRQLEGSWSTVNHMQKWFPNSSFSYHTLAFF